MGIRPSTAPSLLPAGTDLAGRFEIKQFLGAGSFGTVYLARQLVFGHPMRQVALKLFKIDKTDLSDFHDIFSDAVSLIGLIEAEQCPIEIRRHLVQIYDIGLLGEEPKQAFLSMQLVPGGKTLENAVTRWRDGGMPVQTANGFLRQILVPLAWMHSLESPAVHGDIKPDNVLLTEDNCLVLTDFGLAARLPLGTEGGAIQYQAPETLLGGVGGTPSDIYSLGLVWYEMLTGQQPFRNTGLEAIAKGDDKAFVLAQHEARKWPMRGEQQRTAGGQEARIVPPSELNEEMQEHPQLEQMLRKCLAFRQSERYVNARALLADLDRYLATGASGALDLPPAAPEARGARTPQAWTADVLALLGSGDLTRALREAKTLQHQHPKHMPGLLALARVHLRTGDLEQARAVCIQAQRIDPSHADAFDALADVLEADGKRGTAAAMRTRATQLRSGGRR
jgi:serine/threonine protein kinase